MSLPNSSRGDSLVLVVVVLGPGGGYDSMDR